MSKQKVVIAGLIREKVQENLLDVSAVIKDTIRSSNCSEMILQSARTFANQEYRIDECDYALKRMSETSVWLQFQVEAIQKNLELIPEADRQIRTLIKTGFMDE